MRPQCKTFAANLLLEGHRALVVGGGRVGLRKTKTLLEAGAQVTLVCPKALPEFADLPIRHLARPFEPTDVCACRVVIACTDDKVVNRTVREAARAEGILCCCADGNWATGDFIVPATLRTDDLLLSVSTNGQSCRTAKEVKDALARSLAQVSPGKLFILSCETVASLPPRDLLAQRLTFLNGLYGWAFLTTCNRTEFIAWAAPELIESGLLTHALHLPATANAFIGDDAMHHLTMVLAGMRSQMLGEFHIVGQVRDAFEEARTKGWAQGALQRVYAEALRRANEVRAAIEAHLPKIEVEELALEGASGRVVIAGTGALGRAAVAAAHARGLEVSVLYHNTPLNGEVCAPLKDWREVVQGANRLLCCLTVAAPYFTASELPLPVYDLGAPRNVEGDEGVFTLDLLRNAYLERLGCLDTLRATAEAVYQEFSHD